MAIPDIPGYQLLRQIGSGGMATVFLAVQVSLDRKVAIKVLRTSGADDDPERTEKRFLREGRTLAKITHKNVCGIYDIAKVGDIAYIAMEYLDGGTLVDKLKHGVSVGESISIVVQVASALEEAHKLGIIHRDLKPANVMLRGGRVPVLTDFGIARELTASQTRITAENMIVGTPIYMSPEQVSGGEVDGRSDLYALGIMFFELMTGQPPYKGDTPIAVCMQHLTAPLPTLPPDLADLQPVMDRMLAKKREDRYASMSEFTHSLRDVFVASDSMRHVAMLSPDSPWSEQLRELGFSFDTLRDADFKAALEAQRRRSGGKTAKPAAPPPPPANGRNAAAPRATGKRRWPLWAALAGVLLAVGAGGWWLQQGKAPTPPTENERYILLGMRGDFTKRVVDGKLFAPAGDSAMDFVDKMREIHASAEETVVSQDALRVAAVERARAALSSRDLKTLDETLAGMAKGLPDTPELADLTRERAALATELAGEVAARARLGRLRALVEGATPAPDESVLGLYLELRPTFAGDPEFQTLEPRAQASVRAGIEVAMASGNEAGALADARELLRVLPQDASLAALVSKLQVSVNGAQLRTAAQQWRSMLDEAPIDSARLSRLIADLAKLAELGQPPAEHQKLRDLLANAVTIDARQSAKKGEFDAALTLLGQARAGFGNIAVLAETQTTVSEQREKAGEAKRAAAALASQGQLAISAAPWARIDAIVAEDGKLMSLPAQASTPLLLTLPEGRYRITLSAGQGTAKQQQAVTVARDKLVALNLRFEGYGADQYLREVGW